MSATSRDHNSEEETHTFDDYDILVQRRSLLPIEGDKEELGSTENTENTENQGSGSLEDVPRKFDVPDRGSSNDTENEDISLLSRRPTLLERMKTNYSFFNEGLRDARVRLVRTFLLNYFVMAFLVLGIFSIYWGSYYQRNSRFKNLKMLAVIEDEQEVDGVYPYMSSHLREILETYGSYYGNWHIYNHSDFKRIADSHNNSIEEDIARQIHHQKYWSSLYIRQNATRDYYNALRGANGDYNISQNFVKVTYETGRDFLNMNSYVTPNIKNIEQKWLENQANLTRSITGNISSDELADVARDPSSLHLLTTPLVFTYDDRIKFTDPVLVAPSQVGLIYLIIITLFQVNFFQEIHQYMAQLHLKIKVYLFYRFLASVFSYFILSLFYSLVTLAMQVDFTVTFGKSGFLVYWMFSFITMWVVGTANEIMVMLLVLFYPPLIGFWLLFWVIINITPTFSPMALLPKVYRYGYATPLHNSYELTKVVFFNTYKGEMGRNIGILFAWLAALSIAFPAVVGFFGITMKKRAMAAASKQSD